MAIGSAPSERWYWNSIGELRRAQRGIYSAGGSGGDPGGTTEFARREAKFGSFFSGTYTYGNADKKPAKADVGVYPDSDTIRTSLAGNTPATTSVIITAPDTTWQNLNVYGDIKIRAANFTAINCKFFGGPQSISQNLDTGIIDCNNVACVNARFKDCTFIPQKPDINRNAILGHKYTAERCYTFNCNDGFGAYAHPSQPGNLCDVNIIGCYSEEHVYWANSGQLDGTHNDCLQYQGGHNLLVRGNVFITSCIPSIWPDAHPDLGLGEPWSPTNPSIEPYERWLITGTGEGYNKYRTVGGVNIPDVLAYYQCNGAGIVLQDNVGKGTVNVVIDKNWIDRGMSQLNIKPTTGGGSYTITNNRFGRNSYEWTPGSLGYVIRIDSRANTSFSPSLLSSGNVFEDNGAALAEGSGKGIVYNA